MSDDLDRRYFLVLLKQTATVFSNHPDFDAGMMHFAWGILTTLLWESIVSK